MTLQTTQIDYPDDGLRQVVTYYISGVDIKVVSTTLVDKNTNEVLGFVGGRPDDR